MDGFDVFTVILAATLTLVTVRSYERYLAAERLENARLRTENERLLDDLDAAVETITAQAFKRSHAAASLDRWELELREGPRS